MSPFLRDEIRIFSDFERCEPGAMHFFAQLSSSELKMSAQVRKYLVLRMLKQADGAKKCIAPM